ncbi:hypothetical protein TNCV_3833501 [Trichonephila clavipes]|nr:hypothetical protein TNCV_3833501 [Trichonephila clavipes]
MNLRYKVNQITDDALRASFPFLVKLWLISLLNAISDYKQCTVGWYPADIDAFSTPPEGRRVCRATAHPRINVNSK